MYGIGLTINSHRPGTKAPFVSVGIPDDPLNTTTFHDPDELAGFVALVLARGIGAFGKSAMLETARLHLDMLAAGTPQGLNDNEAEPAPNAQVG